MAAPTDSAIQGHASWAHEQDVDFLLLRGDLFTGFIDILNQADLRLNEVDSRFWIYLGEAVQERSGRSFRSTKDI